MTSKDGKRFTSLIFVVVISLILAGILISLSQWSARQGYQPIVSSEIEKPRIAYPITFPPSMGEPNALVTVMEFSDFQCSFCGAVVGKNLQVIRYLRSRNPNWEPIVPNLKPYIEAGQVKFIFYPYPVLGQESVWAAEASLCANEQGKFWEYHYELFANQRGENKGAFSKKNLRKFAARLGLDSKSFNICLDSGKYAEEIQRSLKEGRSLGIKGVPAFLINGQLIEGAVPFSKVKEIIEKELEKAQAK